MMKLNSNGKKYAVLMGFTVLIQGLLFFLSAWDLSIIRAWIYLGLEILYFSIAIILLVLKNPTILNARGKKHQDHKSWDKILVRLYMLFAARLLLIVAGLDLGRFNISEMPGYWIIIGIILYSFSNIISLLSLLENRHFEPYVRIQKEREHSVVDSGPYRFVRHPGYLPGYQDYTKKTAFRLIPGIW